MTQREAKYRRQDLVVGAAVIALQAFVVAPVLVFAS
jgi:hypothetical protein